MMTAGHCDNENWQHGGYSIGTTNLSTLLTFGSVLGDFQRVPTFLASPMNLIYASDTDKSRSMTAIRTYRNQIVGDYVCASGVTNGYRCGSVVDDDYYYGIVFRGQTKYMWGKLAGSTADPPRSVFGTPFIKIANAATGVHFFQISKVGSSYNYYIDEVFKYSRSVSDIETCWPGVAAVEYQDEMLNNGDQAGGTVSNHQLFGEVQYQNGSGWHYENRSSGSACDANSNPTNWRCAWDYTGHNFYPWDNRAP